MDSGCAKHAKRKKSTAISVVVEYAYKLGKLAAHIFFSKKMDKESNKHIAIKQLRCTISSCFDKHNICCKVCDIKKCRYKCNFMDKEACEHQQWD